MLGTILPFLSNSPIAADPPSQHSETQPSSLLPPSSPTSLREEVARLLADLNADTRAVRTNAERRLLELGPDVLPLLPPFELLPSASVRDAVGKIRVALEQRKARQSVQPSHVTVSGTRPLERWLAVVSEQTGNSLTMHDLTAAERARPIELSLEAAPFWKGLDELSQRAGVRHRLDERTDSVRFVSPLDAAVPSEAAVTYGGAFRVSALSPQKREVFGAAGRQLLRVPLRIAAEPRLRPLFLRYAAADLSARTAEGVLLAPLNPEAKYELPLADKGRQAAALQLDFNLPAGRKCERIDLAGKFVMTLAAGSEQVRFTNLRSLTGPRAAPVARRRGGVTVSLERTTFAAGPDGRPQARLRVTVAYDAGGAPFESHRTWMLHNLVYLETPAGKRIDLNGGYETTLQADGAVGIEYRFDNLPDASGDYTFIYVAPTLIIDVPVQFELKGVPVSASEMK